MNRTALLGAVGAVGLVIQIVLGFAVAGTAHPTESAILVPHVVIGVAGLALVAQRTPSAQYLVWTRAHSCTSSPGRHRRPGYPTPAPQF
ncbi:MAG: hypothetical protein JRN07_03810, partial [Nitrososphaerota archaeon]|nr:hypothetical protein [Nitrososphaerota archaeon]